MHTDTYKLNMAQIQSNQEKVATSVFLDTQGQLTLWSII